MRAADFAQLDRRPLVADARGLEAGDGLEVELHDGRVDATVTDVTISEDG